MSQTCGSTRVMRPLLRGDLVHRVTGQLTTVISVVVPCYLVEWGGVGDWNEFLVLFGV